MENARKIFGSNFKGLRESRGFTQEKVADLSGLHRTYIGAVERGERNISLVNIWKLAEALHCSPETFFKTSKNKEQ